MFLLVAPVVVGTPCWHRLMVPHIETRHVGTRLWYLLLVPLVGTACWDPLLVPYLLVHLIHLTFIYRIVLKLINCICQFINGISNVHLSIHYCICRFINCINSISNVHLSVQPNASCFSERQTQPHHISAPMWWSGCVLRQTFAKLSCKDRKVS